MTRAPVIAVTTYPPDDRGRFNLPADYVDAVRRAGGLPWLIAPGEPRLLELVERVDALILTGGGDVDPALYGGAQHATLYGVDPARDRMEIALTRAAIDAKRPTLAICRGCQVVNVALGGTLIEHLPDEVGASVAHRAGEAGTRALHAVDIEPSSLLARIVGSTRPTPSSSHHQAIRRVAPTLEIVARAADGTIEAVELRAHPFFVAVQWHPEHTAADDPRQQRLFDELVAAARACASSRTPAGA